MACSWTLLWPLGQTFLSWKAGQEAGPSGSFRWEAKPCEAGVA